MRRVTIDDIAKQAGVSKTSVSFAFNNPDRLSEATLNQILKVAEELGYSPDPIASNLKTRRTGCIGLLLPQAIPVVARNPHNFEFIEGVGEVCNEAGLSLMLVPPLKGNLRRAISRAAVDGFITLGLEPFRQTVRVLRQRAVPFVMVDSEPIDGIPCVNLDDEYGGYRAMEYILARGHRRIAILAIQSEHHGNYEQYTGLLRRRVSGYLRALGDYDMTIDGDQVRLIECKVQPDEGYRAFMALWRSGNQPTAVVAMGDLLTLGVIRAARELGVRIPDDVSLVGYDDITFSRIATPPLTTIRQPTVEKGRTATRLLIDLIAGKAIENENVLLPVDLVERASVRALEPEPRFR